MKALHPQLLPQLAEGTLLCNLQEAAGVFGYMRDTAALRVEHPRPVDISPECAGMLERLCVAQAQECIYEKFCTDRKDSKTLAKCAGNSDVPEAFMSIDHCLQ